MNALAGPCSGTRWAFTDLDAGAAIATPPVLAVAPTLEPPIMPTPAVSALATAPIQEWIVGAWVTNAGITASYAADGHYTSMVNGQTSVGSYSIEGAAEHARLTTRGSSGSEATRDVVFVDQNHFTLGALSYTRAAAAGAVPPPGPPPSASAARPEAIPSAMPRCVIADPRPPTRIRPAPHDTTTALGQPPNGTQIHIVSREGRWAEIDVPTHGWVFDANFRCE